MRIALEFDIPDDHRDIEDGKLVRVASTGVASMLRRMLGTTEVTFTYTTSEAPGPENLESGTRISGWGHIRRETLTLES